MGLAAAEHDVLIVSPYVGSATIEGLLESVDTAVGITLVTTLVPMNFASGASDIEGLIAVAERPSGDVRSLTSLHAKVFARDWTRWWVGSANFTKSGLAMGVAGNVEILVELDDPPSDLSEIVRSILHRSHTVELDLLEWIREQVPSWRTTPIGELETVQFPPVTGMADDSPDGQRTSFLFQELPFLPSPAELYRAEGDPTGIAHDRFLFGVTPTDAQHDCVRKCRAHYVNIPVIAELSEFLTEPRWFGELSGWFHDRCEDRPVPYRSEIKDLVGRVLTWLLELYPDDFRSARPGHSTCYGRTSADWSSTGGE